MLTLLCCASSKISFLRVYIRSDQIWSKSLISNEISREISYIMSEWIKRVDYSSLQWEWRRNRVVKWIFTTMNEHDEWTKWINRVNEQNEKEWKWREEKWWKKDELWLKKRVNFTLFWSRISVLRNENNTRNENFNNFILCLHFMSSYHVFMSSFHVISLCHFFMSLLHTIFSYHVFISCLHVMSFHHVLFSACHIFFVFENISFRVWRWNIYSLDDIMIDEAIDKIWF